jgi:hypothetical protein
VAPVAASSGHEKTAVFATAAVAPVAAAAADNFDKTLIQQSVPPAAPGPGFEKTAVHQAHGNPSPAAGNSTTTPDIEI